ncbi:MAG: Ig-like domain-containing protein, partial [Limnohabitans sp.]
MTQLSNSGVNQSLLDVAYIADAAASGYGLNLSEAGATEIPVKGVAVGDTVYVRWGNIVNPGQPDDGQENIFSVVVTAEMLGAGGQAMIPVPIAVIEKQGDAKEVAVSTAVLAAGSSQAEPAVSDYTAPVLLAVDIVPPEVLVTAPAATSPLLVTGGAKGMNVGDDLNVLLNNSQDLSYKYALSTDFLTTYQSAYAAAIAAGQGAGSAAAAGQAAMAPLLPPGLAVSNITRDMNSDTYAFNWSLDLTQAISVAQQDQATPQPTFVANDERSVFQVQASSADLVGNADAEDSRNEFIIGTVSDVVSTPEASGLMDEVLNRLTANYGDASVNTRAKIQNLAQAVSNVLSLKDLGSATGVDFSTDMTREVQTIAVTPVAGTYSFNLGGVSYPSITLTGTPTVADIVAAMIAADGANYADRPYTLSDGVSGVVVNYKAFGQQEPSSGSVQTVSIVNAPQKVASDLVTGSLLNKEKQQVVFEGATAGGVFVPSAGEVRLSFGGVNLDTTVTAGQTMTTVLDHLKADSDYAGLPFTLALNAAGDGLVATWKVVGVVNAQVALDRSYSQTTTTGLTGTTTTAGTSPVTTEQLQALDIANVSDEKIGAVARALAEDLGDASEPVLTFDKTTVAAGETATATLTFAVRVGQVPNDVLSMTGGTLSDWTSSDGLTWTATFTADAEIGNLNYQYELVDEVLQPVLRDGTPVRVEDSIQQIALVEALVNRVTDAADKVAAFADTQGASAAPAPTVQDFADLSVSGVRTDNLGAVLDALGKVRSQFDDQADLYPQIQKVSDSYNAVFNTVYASGTQPSAADLLEDLVNIGVSNLASEQVRAQAQTNLLQGALQAVAASKVDITGGATAAQQQAALIDTVAKLEDLLASTERVLARANGETTSGGTVQVSAADLEALGFVDLLADTDGNSRLTSLQKVIADQVSGGGSATVTDYADLKALLENASQAFDGIVGLVAAAQANDAVAISAALGTLMPSSFKAMGVDGVSDVAINGVADAAEMAAIVRDALLNTPDNIDSLEAIQAIVANYTQVLSVASGDVTGANAVITDAQFANLGVELSSDDAQEPIALAQLLSGIIANKASPVGGEATDNVDTIAELQALANAAKKVLDNAELTADPQDSADLVSVADLGLLGFTTVDGNNLDAIQRVLIRNAADRGAVDNYAELNTLIANAVAAHSALTALVSTAQGGGTPDLTGLDQADFAAMGVDGVDSDTVVSVLDALTRTQNTVYTARDIQAIVNSYNAVFDVADQDTGSFSKADLANIGITLSGDLSDNDATLA